MKVRKTGTLLLLAAAAMLSACGGNWKDSPKNWQRAFDEPKPADLEVVHSIYWKASGVAPQFRYFFHAKSNANLIARINTNPGLREVDVKPGPVVTNICGKKPEWFLPKTPENYRTWITPGISSGNLTAYLDRETHEIFLANHLLLNESRAQFQ